ncbi:hypothetical protein ACIBG4_40785 [Nonomuraea sp. NPDC050383]|uniref:hypothetical protein n=1 Tax=Nonomuraea sp. NPDC050383 TaxID=3364362 RepID=UPI003788A582
MEAMITREIVDAYMHIGDDDTEWWMIATANPDGSHHVYALPACTFENLAAEYGFDADDIDHLLKVAMLQLHIPHLLPKENAAKDPAAAKGLVHQGKPVTLGNAATTAQAREAHLERIAWVEQNAVRVVDPVPGRKRTSPAGNALAADTVEVEPHERLRALKQTYKPDPRRIERTRRHLAAKLRRDM